MQENEYTNESFDNDQTDLIHKELSYETTKLANDILVSKNLKEGLDKNHVNLEKEFNYGRGTETAPINIKNDVSGNGTRLHQ